MPSTSSIRALLGVASLAALLSSAHPALAQDPPPPEPPAVPDGPPAPEPPAKPVEPPAKPAATPAKPAPAPAPAPIADAPIADAPIGGKHEEPPRAHADEGDPELAARSLKGHTFLTPLLLDTAFVTTSFAIATEIGRRSVPGVQVTSTNSSGVGHVFTYDRGLGFAAANARLSVAFVRFFEADFEATYQALVPGDTESALIFGGTTAFELRPGVRFRLLRAASVGLQLGLHAYGRFAGGVRLNPGGVLAEFARQVPSISNDPQVIACIAAGDLSCGLPPGFDARGAMEVSRSEYTGGVTVSAAQAIASWFGLQATVGAEVGAASVTSALTGDIASTPFAFQAGLAPSIDLRPHAPIGIMAEYRFRFATETSKQTKLADSGTTTTIDNGVAAGVFYTGKKELQVGAIFRGGFLSSSVSFGGTSVSQPKTTELGGQLAMRYFF